MIPYYGELRVPEFRQKNCIPIFRQPELSPDETIRRIVQAVSLKPIPTMDTRLTMMSTA